jgi:hypothetical protein
LKLLSRHVPVAGRVFERPPSARRQPIVRELQSKGYSLRRMAAELTGRKIATPRGGKWHAETVKMVVRRLAS